MNERWNKIKKEKSVSPNQLVGSGCRLSGLKTQTEVRQWEALNDMPMGLDMVLKAVGIH